MKSIGATAAVLTLSSAALATWAAAPKSQYTIRQNDTVFDNKTGLTWQRRVSKPELHNWQEAKDYCGSLKLGGFSIGWRLPERLELESLVDPRIAPPGPTIDQLAFLDTPSGYYWTASPVAGGSGAAWYIDFRSGASSYYDTAGRSWVRCMR